MFSSIAGHFFPCTLLHSTRCHSQAATNASPPCSCVCILRGLGPRATLATLVGETMTGSLHLLYDVDGDVTSLHPSLFPRECKFILKFFMQYIWIIFFTLPQIPKILPTTKLHVLKKVQPNNNKNMVSICVSQLLLTMRPALACS